MLMAFSRVLSWCLISDVVCALLQSPWAIDKAVRSHAKEQVTMDCWEEKERLNAVSIINYGSKSQAFLHQPPEDSDDEDNDLVQDMFGLGIQSESSTEASSLSDRSSDDEAMLDDEEYKS
uniref:Uncharacterized protein n=1 Tax=Magallana gigas TaxID=29159 RepID=A0A8W8KQB4_MAGGI